MLDPKGSVTLFAILALNKRRSYLSKIEHNEKSVMNFYKSQQTCMQQV